MTRSSGLPGLTYFTRYNNCTVGGWPCRQCIVKVRKSFFRTMPKQCPLLQGYSEFQNSGCSRLPMRGGLAEKLTRKPWRLSLEPISNLDWCRSGCGTWFERSSVNTDKETWLPAGLECINHPKAVLCGEWGGSWWAFSIFLSLPSCGVPQRLNRTDDPEALSPVSLLQPPRCPETRNCILNKQENHDAGPMRDFLEWILGYSDGNR